MLRRYGQCPCYFTVSEPGEIGDLPAVQGSHRVLGVVGILVLDERKAGRIAGNEDVPKLAIVRESPLDFFARSATGETTDVDLAVQGTSRLVTIRHAFCELPGLAGNRTNGAR